MSRREPTQFTTQEGAPLFWKSLEEKTQGPVDGAVELPFGLTDDAPKGFIDSAELRSMQMSDDDPRLEGVPASVSRRGFFKFGTAVTALFGLEACVRRPEEKLMPYTRAPEYMVPGISSHFATVLSRRGEALGVVVESHEGRPTKVEGNVDHPASLGGTDIAAQAAIFDLYDPDRSRTAMGPKLSPSPSAGGASAKSPIEMTTFEASLQSLLKTADETKGAKLRFLVTPSNSPTEVRLRGEIKKRFPNAQFHLFSAANDLNAKAGAKIAFGKPLNSVVDYARAKVIVSLDCDFLQTEAGSVRAARAFADGRRLSSPSDPMNRLYVVESTHTTTGANSDHRLRLRASDVGYYAKALAKELGVNVGASSSDGIPAEWLKEVAKDLQSAKERAVVVVGANQPPAVHALAHAMNAALGSQVVSFSSVTDEEELAMGSLEILAQDMLAGKVDTLLIVGGNPVYNAPASAKFAEALSKVKSTIHLSSHYDETSRLCTFHVPMAHAFESWGDARSFDGTWSIQQPLIAPLHGGKSTVEFYNWVVGPHSDGVFRTGKGYDRVRETLFSAYDGPETEFEKLWKSALKSGLVARMGKGTVSATTVNTAEVSKEVAKIDRGKQGLEVVFSACPKVGDGSSSNNAWLMELPDPMTRIVWDNVAHVSPKTAQELGISKGDMLEVTTPTGKVKVAAWIQPGQADNSLTLFLGWGRTVGRYATALASGENLLHQFPHYVNYKLPHEAAEREGRGFNVYPAKPSDRGFSEAQVSKTGATFTVVQTQEHHSMEGRPIAIYEKLENYRTKPNFPAFRSPSPRTLPLWTPQDYTKTYKWGLNIDLTTCTGCNACVIACQSENNIPIVGKDQVRRGREMHWMRIDRYFVGNETDPKVAQQPVACVQCEQAPCENVCPVNATEHSPEGLNDMAYNRCIGTRYCANNCPYKVRRFNYLEFQGDPTYGDLPETVKMQFNPNVTVRMRGVIEKCTYCVQRIQEAKIGAKRTGTALKDGDFTTACAQACPSQAITFGDLNDKSAKVTQAASRDRNYQLLAEIGTHPRTSYLGKILNPNAAMNDPAYTAMFQVGKEHG